MAATKAKSPRRLTASQARRIAQIIDELESTFDGDGANLAPILEVVDEDGETLGHLFDVSDDLDWLPDYRFEAVQV